MIDLLVGEDEWQIRYLLVDTGEWLSGHKVLIAPDWIEVVSWLQSQVWAGLSEDEVAKAPEYQPSEQIRRDYEADLYEHYRRTAYWAQDA